MKKQRSLILRFSRLSKKPMNPTELNKEKSQY